jgi:phage/plasmid-associated DNA primase
MTVSDGNDHSEEVSLFLELLHLMCGKDQILTTYVGKWLAHALQRPYELPGVMLIVSGGKGVGKDTTFDFLGKHVYGKYSAINSVNNKQFWDKHDTGRKGKFLVKLEEADRKTCIDNAQSLKGLITGESIIYNGKNEKPVSVPNYCRFVFTTNKGNPVDFSEAERRFVILPCSADKKGDSAFWCKVRETLFNDQVGKAVADFLLGIDLTDFDVRKLPENAYQANVVEAAASPEQRFVEAWNGEETSATAFYQLYRDYCVENDYEYVTSQKRFGNLMLTFIRDGLIIKQLKNTGTLYKK